MMAVRYALERDNQVAGKSDEVVAAILAEGMGTSPAIIRRALEAAAGLGAIEANRVVDLAPIAVTRELQEAMLSPEAIRQRRCRERRREQAAGLVTLERDGHALVTGSHGLSVTEAVTVTPAPVSFGPGWVRNGEAIQQLGVPGELVTERDHGRDQRDTSHAAPIRNVNQDKHKNRSVQRVETVSGARASTASGFTDPGQLTNNQKTRWFWVQGRLKQAQDELSSAEWAQLIEALPDQLVLSYAQGRCLLPRKAYQTLNALDAKRRGREEQREMALGPVGMVKGDAQPSIIRAAERPDMPMPVLKRVVR